ncbi:MAG: hypothetical protein H6R13_1113 [Proteobacteria bacterium]|nr:hypothetical protein [Pseudomonadota bacterium]
MRTFGRISSVGLRMKADVYKRQNQSACSSDYGAAIPSQWSSHGCTTDTCKQRNAIGQIGRMANTASSNRDGHAITDICANRVVNLIGFWPSAKHLG